MLRSSRYVGIPWLVSFQISLKQQRCQFSTFCCEAVGSANCPTHAGVCLHLGLKGGLPKFATKVLLSRKFWPRPTALQTYLQVIDANGTSELDGSRVQRIQATGVQSAGLFRMVSPAIWGASEDKSETSWFTNSHEWSDEVSSLGSSKGEPWGNSVPFMPFSRQSVGCCSRNSGTFFSTRASLAMKFTSDTLFKLSCR